MIITHNDWHDVECEPIEELFRHVIRAHGVLEAQVELVLVQFLQLALAAPLATFLAAAPESLDVDVLGKLVDVRLSFAIRRAVGYEPEDGFQPTYGLHLWYRQPEMTSLFMKVYRRKLS